MKKVVQGDAPLDVLHLTMYQRGKPVQSVVVKGKPNIDKAWKQFSY